jgi:hypothetical protein
LTCRHCPFLPAGAPPLQPHRRPPYPPCATPDRAPAGAPSLLPRHSSSPPIRAVPPRIELLQCWRGGMGDPSRRACGRPSTSSALPTTPATSGFVAPPSNSVVPAIFF